MVSTTQSLEYVNLNLEDDEVSVTGLINEMQRDNETGYSSTDSEDSSKDETTEEVKALGSLPLVRRGRKLIVDKKSKEEKKREKEEEKSKKKKSDKKEIRLLVSHICVIIFVIIYVALI